MNKRLLPIISLLLALMVFIGALSSCGLWGGDEETSSTNGTESTQGSESQGTNGTDESNGTNGESSAPEGGETSTPEGGETSTPEGGETSTPEGGETSTPEGGETSTPEGGETSTPEGGETSTPAGGETSTPEGGETSTPEGGETSTPEGGETSTPEGGETSTPEGGETSTPEGGMTEETKETEETLISGDNADLIELSNKLANGVYPYYTDNLRNELTIVNTKMILGYRITNSDGDMTVSHISNKDGHAYIKDTMDVFVRMTDQSVYYAGKSVDSRATLNIYRYGYYFYENRLEGQTFVNSSGRVKERTLPIHGVYLPEFNEDGSYARGSHDVNNFDMFERTVNGETVKGFSYEITGNDPYILFTNFKVKAEDYDFIEVTIKAPEVTGASEIYIIAGGSTTFNSKQLYSFGLKTDGQEHTYQIPLSTISNYTGTLSGLRFDINSAIGTRVEISNLKLFKLDLGNSPADLKIQRSFVTYSDKLHHVLQVSTLKEVENIQVFGMKTEIDANTVAKFVIKDRRGLHYDTLDKIGWNTVEYVGFDIKGAGIFGFILPYDGSGGTIKVRLEDGVYIIEQTKAPDGYKLSPSCNYNPELEAQKGRYDPIVPNNGNDFFMGQRIYTDTYHTFDKFINEAECERNPLTDENIKVDIYTDGASFAGYNALYGYYKFNIAGTGFNQPYYKFPNKHYEVNFTVTGDEYNRTMYFMSYTTSGQLECAVLLDGNKMLLPVPLEVAKNFIGDGENTIYNNEDRAYGEAYFPMIVNAGETRSYTIVNLYQNWGNVPLKQLSSIQYHTPYYHLSTGVTETNCIVPFAVVGPALPDFRGMSAPLWKSQPQHTSGGGHSFLCYTDSDGVYHTSDTTGVKIDSYGPTYADIALDYITSDGKISATYTHMEMPQTDENRSYYEMRYTVLEDVSITDFKNNFRFYYCTDNNSQGVYEKIGYLDENNQYQVVDATDDATKTYVLGDDCPYFSFFMMPNWLRDNPHAEGYTNLAFLIYNYEIIINGQKVDTNFYLRNTKNALSLSLNLENVELKKGDTFTINAILMPWGSQELEDDPANRYNQSHIPENFHGYTYSSVLPDGTLYMDKNVRDVRENTLLNPIKGTAEKDCEVIQSVYLPKFKTTNGKSAEFTLSGGHNNQAVRIYGFDALTVPQVEEFVDGEWKVIDLSSANHLDDYGYGYYYDGYMVNYDGDGTYSYSFVVTMNNGEPRKFRISTDKEFEGWPEVPEDDNIIEDPIKFFLQPKEILIRSASVSAISGALLSKNKDVISLSGHSGAAETYMNFFQNSKDEPIVTGQYVVIKYRVPTGIVNKLQNFEFFASTTSTQATGDGDRLESVSYTDDQWHVIIIDVSTLEQVKPNDNGEYSLNFFRWDLLNGKISSEMYIDVAYFGIHDDLSELYALELNKEIVPTETPKYVELIEGSKTTKIDPKTGETYVPTYIDPTNEQGYKVSDVEYAAWIDMINRASNSFSMHNNKSVVEKVNPTKQTIGDGLLVLTGWAMADGGIEKYVWSADGGKTWHDVVLYNDYPIIGGSDAYVTAYGNIKQYTDSDGNTVNPQPTDIAASKVNCGFQGNGGIAANLADYYETGTTVSVTFAAVPKADTSSLCLIGHITNVEVYVAPPIAPSETVNLPLTPEAIHNKVVEKASNYTFLSSVLSEDKSVVRFNAKADAGDQYGLMMNGNTTHTGQYLYLKYKLPTGYSTHSAFQIFTSTVNGHFTGSGDNFTINGLIQDDEWHVVIVDVSQKLLPTMFGRNGEGRFVAKYLRVDVFEQKASEGMYAEFAAMGFADNLDVIYKEICSDMEFVTVIGSSTQKIDPATGEAYVKTYIDPTNAQGYTKSSVEFAGYIDMVNGMGGNKGTAKAIRSSINSTKAVFEFSDHCGTTLEGTQLLTFSGWVVVNGGIEKYVWSADGGKTWNDVQFHINQGFANAGNAHLQQLEAIGAVITDRDSTIKKALFQGGEGGGATTAGIAANLSDYAGQKVNVTFAAVPKTDTDGLCILLYVSGVQVPVIEATEEPAT